MTVSTLNYRLYGASKNITRSISVAGTDVSLYDQPDIIKNKHNLHIYRAKINFLFQATNAKKEPIKRSITLNEPSGISYGKAFPEQRLIIDRILSDAKLMDQSDKPDPRRVLPTLGRFQHPQLLSEARDSLGHSNVAAYMDAGFLVPAAALDRSWCSACGETHAIREEFVNETHVYRCDCNQGFTKVDPINLETVTLDIDTILSFTLNKLKTDQITAKPINDDTWFLGISDISAPRKRLGIVLTVDYSSQQNTEAILKYLSQQKNVPKGVVLSLSNVDPHSLLSPDWSVCEVGSILTIKDQKLTLDQTAYKTHTNSKQSSERASPEQWETFFKKYDETKTGKGHYQEADRMIAEYKDLCRVGRTTLAKKLKKRFPDHF